DRVGVLFEVVGRRTGHLDGAAAPGHRQHEGGTGERRRGSTDHRATCWAAPRRFDTARPTSQVSTAPPTTAPPASQGPAGAFGVIARPRRKPTSKPPMPPASPRRSTRPTPGFGAGSSVRTRSAATNGPTMAMARSRIIIRGYCLSFAAGCAPTGGLHGSQVTEPYWHINVPPSTSLCLVH